MVFFHINDWFGGTHCGLWEWTSNYGGGKVVKPGDALESTVRLQLAQPLRASLPNASPHSKTHRNEFIGE
jgi:hypothetical protein